MPDTRISSMSAKSRTYLWLLAGTAGLIRFVIALRSLPDGLFDDAYVTLRYAANLINGVGFVFNAGERVLGTTSPLFALLLAAAGHITGPRYLEEIAAACGILASMAAIFLCGLILDATGLPQAVQWTFLALIAFLPAFVSNSVSGMETPVVVFLMCLSLYLYMKNRLILLSLVGFLLVLGRIDTGFWLLALAIAIVWDHRAKPWSELVPPLALFCGAALAWFVFVKIYFGSVIPQSVVGKAVSHGGFERLDWNYVLTFLSAFVPAQRLGVWGLPVIAAVFIAMVPPVLELWRGYPALRPIIYFFPMYAGVFLAVHAPLFSWYSIPPKFAFYLLLTYALWWALTRAAQVARSPVKADYALALAGVCAFALAIRTAAKAPQSYGLPPLDKYVEANVKPTNSVFLEHIGLIGYKTGCHIFDSMGLVTPETTRLRRLYGSDWLPKAAREYHADFVILYDSDLPAIRSQSDNDAIWFQQHYTHVADYGTQELVASVYVINDGIQASAGGSAP